MPLMTEAEMQKQLNMTCYGKILLTTDALEEYSIFHQVIRKDSAKFNGCSFCRSKLSDK